MKRTEFLRRSGAVVGLAAAPRTAWAAAETNAFRPTEGTWRSFKVTTVATVAARGGAAHIWVPIPCFYEADWMRPGDTTWKGNASFAQIATVGPWNIKMVDAQWRTPVESARLEVTSICSTRDLAVDLTRRGYHHELSADEYRFYTAPTKLQPTSGIVAETAKSIVGYWPNDLTKAKLIYEWVVLNASRNPKTRGCGLGDVSFMLQTGDLNGKCADINGLFVALARAAGIPARDLYGIRTAPSRFGYKSLGANSDVITKAQHCRAEVFLSDYGWVPADPADVRKVVLEEPPGNLPLNDPKVVDARDTLFGAWEGNYVAYNDGHDVALPGSHGDTLGFLMYPQAEVAGVRSDSLDPADFVYTIASEEIS
jgi:transglutaminase-like putative cysteine protease